MEDIIDLIAGNWFLIALIIGGIIKVLSGASEDHEEKRQKPVPRPRTQAPRPTPTPSGGGNRPNTVKPVPVQSVSIEEQQQKQLDQLAGKLLTDQKQTLTDMRDEDHHAQSIDHEIPKMKPNTNYEHVKYKKQIKGQLTRNGLIEGIIMSEVLGPPRARKPHHQSAITGRK